MTKTVAAMTPLNWAMINSPGIVSYIIDKYRDVFADELKKQGLRLFSEVTDESILKRVYSLGVDLSPLIHEYVKRGCKPAVRFLLEKYPGVADMTDKYGFTPMYYAERYGEKTKGVKELLSEYAAHSCQE